MMFKIFLVLISLVLLFCTVEAGDGRGLYGGFGYFSAGFDVMKFSEINSRLTAKGYPSFGERFISIGGGGFGVWGSFMMGGEGYGLVIGLRSNEKFNTRFSGGYGMFSVGYVILNRGGLILYPKLSLGWGGLSLRVEERGSYAFDDLLNNPRRGFEIERGGLMVGVGIGVNYFDLFPGFQVGLSSGYVFMVSGRWRYGEEEVIGMPRAGFDGFYIRLVIGGGRVGGVK